MSWISKLIRWCCQKPKKASTVVPVQKQSYVLSAAALIGTSVPQPATLTYTPHVTTSYTLTAEVLIGTSAPQPAGLAQSAVYVLSADTLYSTSAPKNATLRATRRLRAGGASSASTVQAATLRRGRVIVAGLASSTSSPKAATLTYSSISAPESIVTAGLQSVWAYKVTPPGPTLSLTKAIGVDTLPLGVTDNGTRLIFNTDTVSPLNVSQWDFRGRYLTFIGSGTVNLSQFRASVPAGSPQYNAIVGSISAGDAASSPTVNLSYFEMDAVSGYLDSGAFLTRGGALNCDNFYLHDCITPFLMEGGNVTLSNFYVYKIGNNTNNGVPGLPTYYDNSSAHGSPGGTHINMLFQMLNTGTFTASNGSVDLSGFLGNQGGGFTSALGYSSTFSGDTTMTLTNIIAYGRSQVTWSDPSLYVGREPQWLIHLEDGDLGDDSQMTCTNCVFEPGESGYSIKVIRHGGTATLTATDCLDFDTAANIDASLNA